MTLTEVLQDKVRLDAVVRDGAVLIDEEVAGKGGLRGAALRAGYKTVKALKPGMIEDALRHLLPDFAPAVDPHYTKAKASGAVRSYFTTHAAEIAESMLSVTDRKARNAKSAVVKRVYDGLRGSAAKHTAEAVPRLADLISKHVP